MEREWKVSMGASSLLMVIVIFALTIFAVLSVQASSQDLLLAKKTREQVQSYYEADTTAEHLLRQITLVLEHYYNDKSGIALKVQLQEIVAKRGTVEARNDKRGTISYSVAMREGTYLQVQILYNMEAESKPYYNITKWSVSKRMGS